MLVEFEKKNFNGGIFLLLGANVLVEFENVFLIWGQMGANVLVEFENVILIGGIFFIIGGKCVSEINTFFLIGGIFYNWGHFFLKLGAKNNFRIEKINYFGNYIDPWLELTINETARKS